MKNLFFLLFLASGMSVNAQVAINADGSLPDNSAMLDVKSPYTGILIPRMNAGHRDEIVSPATGLMIFCTDDKLFYSNIGTPVAPNWVALNSQWLSNGSSIYYDGGKIGIGTDNPQAALDISSTTQGFLPPRLTQLQIDALAPVAGLQVFNATTLKPNYYDGTQWRNFDGTVAFGIGVSCLGGTIAYILQSGDPGFDANAVHGLIASSPNLTADWGCSGTEIPGADGTAIGTGNQNTIDIVDDCTSGGIAAKLCSDLTLNGFSDWYLPSINELNMIYINRTAIGGFIEDFYWSSSETNSNVALSKSFNSGGGTSNLEKYNTFYVRAIRAF